MTAPAQKTITVDADDFAALGETLKKMDDLSAHCKPVGKLTWLACNQYDDLREQAQKPVSTGTAVAHVHV